LRKDLFGVVDRIEMSNTSVIVTGDESTQRLMHRRKQSGEIRRIGYM